LSLICLDSSALIALEKGQLEPGRLRERFPGSRFVSSVVSVYEQAYGAYFLVLKGSRKKGEAILEGLKHFKTYALASEIALLAAKISAELAVKGTLVEPADIFVGATCIQNSLELLTSNTRHFEPLIAYGLLLHAL